MALHEYHCTKCGTTFERLIRGAGHERRVSCPECGGRRVRRRISRFATAGGAARDTAGGCGCGGSCACGRH